MDKVILPTGFLPMHTVKQIEAAKPKEKLRRLPIALFILLAASWQKSATRT
ncbi:hypothetical protein [Escherichia sp. E5028]|uniref:hypothetical protein n=1 Tax=Escherichia sp. E5028 TaxID=2044602 RepID=UPI001436AC71|nr:hypothetical protein [Escherichia sp. E5028]